METELTEQRRLIDAKRGPVRPASPAGYSSETPYATMELTMRNAKNSAMTCCLSMPPFRPQNGITPAGEGPRSASHIITPGPIIRQYISYKVYQVPP